MDLSNLVTIWCAIMSTLQGLGSFLAIVDRQKAVNATSLKTYRANSLIVSIVLLLGTFVTIGFGCWTFFAKPLRPRIVQIPQIVEKTAPCPPVKTGPATSKGNNSPAHSGSGDTYQYGRPDDAKSK